MVFVKGLTLRSGNFVFLDDELGYFNHSKNLFQDSISLFSEFVYNNDKDCVESVFKNGSDFSTILLLPEFVDVELDEIVDFIERLNEIKGFSVPLDYLLENGIETKGYKQYKNINISVYQEYSSLFRLRCVTNITNKTDSWFNIKKKSSQEKVELKEIDWYQRIKDEANIEKNKKIKDLSEMYPSISYKCKYELDKIDEQKNKQILTKFRKFLPNNTFENKEVENNHKNKLYYIKIDGDYKSFKIKNNEIKNKNLKNKNNEKFLLDVLKSNYYNIPQKTIKTDGYLIGNLTFDNIFKKVYKYINSKKEYSAMLFLYSDKIEEEIISCIEKQKQKRKLSSEMDCIPVSLYRTSIDLTNLKQYEILNIYNRLNNLLTPFKIDDTGIQFGVKPVVNNDGVFVEFGYFFEDDLKTNFNTLKELKKSISDFFNQNKNIREEIVFKNTKNLNREVFRVVAPPLETNIVYICYFPKSKVVKVGKTVDWGSRERTYKRGGGKKKETKEYMKLIYWYESPTVGDEVIDFYLMNLTEYWLINLAKKMYDKFDGDEFFQADEKLEILKKVKSSIGKLSIQDLLKQRTDKQIKRFCYGNTRYDSKNLYDKLMELKYNK